MGRDGNDQMYPIARAVAEGENNLSWEWFFLHLKDFLELDEGQGVCIISDEHMGILNAVKSVLPKVEHRHCGRHVFAHWPKSFREDEIKLHFWKIAKCYNLADYNDAIEDLNKLDPYAAVAFKAYNPKLFCRAFLDCSVKSDAITSNMAETFNGYIINARTKHLIYMLEDIRCALMQRLLQKRLEMQKCTSKLCPKIQRRLEKDNEKAAIKWDMVGIPCFHAIACIFFLHQDAEDYVGSCYWREVYFKAYAGSIPPCEGERHWPKVNYTVEPPPIKIGPGRPRKNRIKDLAEIPSKPGHLSRVGMEMTCSHCLVKGHNKRRCPNKD